MCECQRFCGLGEDLHSQWSLLALSNSSPTESSLDVSLSIVTSAQQQHQTTNFTLILWSHDRRLCWNMALGFSHLPVSPQSHVKKQTKQEVLLLKWTPNIKTGLWKTIQEYVCVKNSGPNPVYYLSLGTQDEGQGQQSPGEHQHGYYCAVKPIKSDQMCTWRRLCAVGEREKLLPEKLQTRSVPMSHNQRFYSAQKWLSQDDSAHVTVTSVLKLYSCWMWLGHSGPEQNLPLTCVRSHAATSKITDTFHTLTTSIAS